MITKDALKQGDSFVAANVAPLRICDEFLISEGYLAGGTMTL